MTTNALANTAAAQSAIAIRDIKPPVEIPSGWTWLLWVLGSVLLAALLFQAWRMWQRWRSFKPPEPVIPPHERARRRLEEALALIRQPREFCILVSDTIRAYLEERFDFRAPERTTEEFLHELKETNLLTPNQKDSLGHFLQRCDLVKFARYEPGEPELRDLHQAALRLVEETEPVAPQPEAPSATGDRGRTPGTNDERAAELQTADRALP